MAMTAIKLKIMPIGLDVNFEELKKQVEKKLEEFGAIINSTQEEPIAFGLKALIVTIGWPEDKGTEVLETLKVEGMNSCQIIDYRRAIG